MMKNLRKYRKRIAIALILLVMTMNPGVTAFADTQGVLVLQPEVISEMQSGAEDQPAPEAVPEESSLSDIVEIEEESSGLCGTAEIPDEEDPKSVTGDKDYKGTIGTSAFSSKRKKTRIYSASPYLPAPGPSYNGVAEGKLPPLRNQAGNPSCWAHGSIATMESDLIHDGKADASIDLSEMHLYYFAHKYNVDTVDPLGGTKGDYQNIRIGTGHPVVGLQALANWTGAAREEDYPYVDFSSNPGYTYPPEEQYGPEAFHVQGVYILPYSNTDDPEGNRTLIKQYIKEHGSVTTTYYEGSAYYRADTNSYYCGSALTQNHAIAIVGWDDDFPAGNFKQTPSGNGAWLIRNSWTEGEARYSHNGYFWISYYDKTIRKTLYATDAEPASNYDNNYQYDGTDYLSSSGYGIQDTFKAANIFTAHANGEGTETIKAVSFETYDTVNAEYTVSVYTGLTDPGDPESGQLKATVSGKTECDGYYTVPIGSGVKVESGALFSVVVAITKHGDTPMIAIEKNIKNSWLDIRCAADKGQSFLYNNEKWIDYGEDANSNVRIKAFTVNDPIPPKPDLSDPYLKEESEKYQWHIDAVHARDAWETSTGSGVTVAVLDSGVIDEGDLSGKVKAKVSMTGDAEEGDALIHGTPVAGAIASVRNNSYGGAGIAPDAQILSIKVVPGENVSGLLNVDNETLCKALTEALKPEYGVDIINMSFQTKKKSAKVQKLIDEAYNKGILCVAAAGNNGNSQKVYPAAYNHVLSVGAYTDNGQLMDCSDYGSWVSIAAPGSRIYSTGAYKNDPYGYNMFEKTSMASPMAAGTAALIYAADPAFLDRENRTGETAEKVMNMICGGADPRSYSNGNGQVYGGLNALSALQCEPSSGEEKGEFTLCRSSNGKEEELRKFTDFAELSKELAKINDPAGDYLVKILKNPGLPVAVRLPKKAGSLTFAGAGSQRAALRIKNSFALTTDVILKNVSFSAMSMSQTVSLRSRKLSLEHSTMDGFGQMTAGSVKGSSAISLWDSAVRGKDITGIGLLSLSQDSLLNGTGTLKLGNIRGNGTAPGRIQVNAKIKYDKKGKAASIRIPASIAGSCSPEGLPLEILSDGEFLDFSSPSLSGLLSQGIRLVQARQLTSFALRMPSANRLPSATGYYKVKGYLTCQDPGKDSFPEAVLRYTVSSTQVDSRMRNIQEAVEEIRSLKERRAYSILLTKDAGSLTSANPACLPQRFRLPGSRYCISLNICPYDERVKTIRYVGSIKAGTDLVLRDLSFVRMKEKNHFFYEMGCYETESFSAANHSITILGRVSFAGPLLFSGGGKKSRLVVSGSLNAGGVNRGIAPAEAYLEGGSAMAGRIRSLGRLSLGGKVFALCDYKLHSLDAKETKAELSVGEAELSPGQSLYVSGNPYK